MKRGESMKRTTLSHPRVLDDPKYAEMYYKHNIKRGKTIAQSYIERLKSLRFDEGKILDTGCGPGIYTIELAKSFPKAKVIGIDLSEPLLDIARKNAQNENVSDYISFQKQDVLDIQFDDNSFNAIFNINMVHTVEKPLIMLNDIERILAPKGILEIADIKRSRIGYLMLEFKSAYSEDEVKDLISQSNLQQGSYSGGFFWWGYEMIKK
jgi:ubiquinone/menaquinone biosynthesis C-methylase UbiE